MHLNYEGVVFIGKLRRSSKGKSFQVQWRSRSTKRFLTFVNIRKLGINWKRIKTIDLIGKRLGVAFLINDCLLTHFRAQKYRGQESDAKRFIFRKKYWQIMEYVGEQLRRGLVRTRDTWEQSSHSRADTVWAAAQCLLRQSAQVSRSSSPGSVLMQDEVSRRCKNFPPNRISLLLFRKLPQNWSTSFEMTHYFPFHEAASDLFSEMLARKARRERLGSELNGWCSSMDAEPSWQLLLTASKRSDYDHVLLQFQRRGISRCEKLRSKVRNTQARQAVNEIKSFSKSSFASQIGESTSQLNLTKCNKIQCLCFLLSTSRKLCPEVFIFVVTSGRIWSLIIDL